MAINKIKQKKIRKISTISKKDSAYGIALKERCKFKLYYNVKIHQLKTKISEFAKSKSVHESIFEHYESLLSTVVYRLGFAASPRGAAQLISHKNILVNDIVMKHKLYKLKVGDKISVHESLHNNSHIHSAIKKNIIKFTHLKSEGLSGIFCSTPSAKELYLTQINFAQACSSQLRS